jgi:hypothetical protein
MKEDNMKTVNIKGKEYVMVNERIKYFRENLPEYSLETEIIKLDDRQIIMKAIVKNEKGRVIATGHAEEKQGDGYINKTSFIENCETSAVGRALGCMGIGIDAGIASAEEVANAMNKQEPKNPVIDRFNKFIENQKYINFDKAGDIVRGKYGKNIENLTTEQQTELKKIIEDYEYIRESVKHVGIKSELITELIEETGKKNLYDLTEKERENIKNHINTIVDKEDK